MKDLDLKDILARRNRSLTQLAVYRSGTWQFITPTNLRKVQDNQNFFLISESFRLSKQGTQDPVSHTLEGKPGDYVAVDSFGTYALVTEAEYKRLFPAPNLNPPAKPNNSDQLKDSKFLTSLITKTKPSVL